MIIKNFLGTQRNRLVRLLMPFQPYKIGKYDIIAVRGTIRKSRDQDDAWLYALLGQSDSYFDIGCNVGFTSLMGLVQKDMRVIMVDPSPEAITLAAKNIIKNSLSKNVSFFPAFVSDSADKEIDFYSDGWGAANSMYSSHAKTAARKESVTKVRTVTVDHLMTYYNVVPDLVKIDVEGAELQVLDGSVALASKRKAQFFIEMHRLEERSMKTSGQYVIDWCTQNNYNAFYLSKHCPFTDSEQIASRGKCHLLLLPKGQEYPEVLRSIQSRAALG